MSRRLRFGASVAAAVAVLAGALSACSSGSSGGTVTLDFWGWAPGYDKSVAAFNAAHSDVKVNFHTIQSGGKGGYAKIKDAVKAGNAPCLAQIGYETLPTFAAAGELQDISQYANPAKGQFVPFAWNQVGLQGQVFGIPVDTGPEALFYRKDLFTKYGLAVPKTWDQFAADAKKLHTADPGAYLTTSPQDAYELSGLAWQNGAHWFGTSGNQWKITINDAASKKVAQYWEGLLDQKLIKNEPSWDTGIFADLSSSKVLSLVTAVWGAPLIQTNAPTLSGKWAVAPMPQWSAGADVAGNQGGSATAVLKGCANPQQAEEFAQWFSTNSGSVSNLIKNTGIYPAATSGLSNSQLSTPSAYFGGQNIYDVFKDAATHTSTDWQWGPTMDQVESDFTDVLKTAGNGSVTVQGSLDTVQTKTVAAVKGQGLQVSGS